MRTSHEHTIRRSPEPEPRLKSEKKAKSARAGFTLIELLMVVTIIGILIAMILPAVAGVMTSARIAEARTEISGLETALTEFKAKYGVYPPSNIRLSEVGGTWTADAKSKIREIFGTSFDFTINRDINGDGNDIGPPLVVNGAECLVFFLGGVNDKNNNAANSEFVKIGFSNNPADPFSPDGQSRVGPFFKFDIGRFTNLYNTNQFMPEYKDTLPDQTAPYLYVSTSATGVYDPADLLGSGMENVYRFPKKGEESFFPRNHSGEPYHKKSYQIISPGFDNEYGHGGAYDPDDPNAMTIIDGQTDPGPPIRIIKRFFEQDNITNFSKGQLGN